MIEAKVIADSINKVGNRLTTLQLIYPRFIHSEVMTHRVFSRNASSSRAIPVKKMLDMVRNEPAMPIHWGKNQAGMQASEEFADAELKYAKSLWLHAANMAADVAEAMNELGLHKQVANRILEPFQHIHVVITATEFDNFMELRAHPDAQPEIHELATQMQNAISGSKPVERGWEPLDKYDWHLPYVSDVERAANSLADLLKISPARCCRVSYLKHDGTSSSIQDDILLCDRLAGSRPIHASPFEHQAVPGSNSDLYGNFKRWTQYRKLIEQSFK
ncbi:THY1 Predicted alternative thymidylate synthase [uncultured Caudovirales phage]|uniref:THY1 Predicted alternative thymidylate synthase n=1 Tax=uncultured Caudovirales phage TaxID=2100421 RepID=A0A6J5KRK2_9CAUD|nr:THY1 Predicted alternative thymidylate synthase [uncultured Caudovirales phage]CAB4123882.1 THY1 Predicted alternative thymidylate synthase [uncultured Caudovirales phage]CAB5219337.1 THY1 Predicted alternative thymidylate synthase [uncultured Caudovirales phage]